MKRWIALATFAAVLLTGCGRPTENSPISAAMPGGPNAATGPPAADRPTDDPPAYPASVEAAG